MSAKRSTPAPTSPKSRSNTPKTPRRRTRAAIWAGSRVARSPISLRRTSSSPSWLVRLASSTAGLRRRPGTRSSRSPTRATSTTIRRRPLRITRTSTGSTSRRRLTTSSASSPASSSSSTAALAAVLGRWPLGIDLVPASRLDRHAFSTLRAVAIALDGPVDWALLRARYPSAHPVTLLGPDRTTTLAEAERQADGARFLVLAPLDPFADLASLGTVMRIAEKLRAPDGCPWDREQTHASLRPHLLEDAYEARPARAARALRRGADAGTRRAREDRAASFGAPARHRRSGLPRRAPVRCRGGGARLRIRRGDRAPRGERALRRPRRARRSPRRNGGPRPRVVRSR